jgi:prolyl oligopeptidase PreP (S9A serine peptidase family)
MSGGMRDGVGAYPPLLMTTSTRDDRVHPYHARCFVRRLLDLQQRSGSANGEGGVDKHDTDASRSLGTISILGLTNNHLL